MVRTVTAIVGLVSCLSISACTEGGVSAAPTTTSPSSTSAAQTTPTGAPTSAPTDNPQPPELPARAEEKSPAGAKAFVKYYIDVLNNAWLIESSEAIRQSAGAGCKVCTQLAELVDAVSRRGGYQHGGQWRPVSTFAVPTQPDRKPIIITDIKIARGKWLRSSGGQPQLIEAQSVTYDFQLAWEESRWLLTGIEP